MTDTAQLAGLRVLVVEDEMMVSMLIEDMLTDLGCSVRCGIRRCTRR